MWLRISASPFCVWTPPVGTVWTVTKPSETWGEMTEKWPARLTALIWLFAIAAAVLILLGIVFTLGFYGDSRWSGVLFLFSGTFGALMGLRASQLRRRLLKRDPVVEAATVTEEAGARGRRSDPLIVGIAFLLVGTLAEDVVVGVMGGLAGLAFGYLATVPIERKKRKGVIRPRDDEKDHHEDGPVEP